jgi:hypothetical protein
VRFGRPEKEGGVANGRDAREKQREADRQSAH